MRQALAYIDARKPTVRTCYNGLRCEIELLNSERKRTGEPLLIVPSLRTFHRAVAALPSVIVNAGRHGLTAALRKERAASSKRDGEKE